MNRARDGNGAPPIGSAALRSLHLNDPAGNHFNQWHRRRAAAARCIPLACGCRDPWPCRCADPPPTERQIDGYRAAVAHLRAHGLPPAPLLPEMRALWRRGAHGLISEITERWELAG